MPRILVAEDEPAIALPLKDDLELEGYAVEVVGDGEEALRKGRDEKFDLIILDVMLPKKDGFEVCRGLRRSGGRTPILMLTARAQDVDKAHGLDLGADDYVTKPFSPLELRARIKALLRRAAGDHHDVYRFGDCEVDFTRFELRSGGHVVGLTPIEFKLLATFVRHKGRVLTRDQLLDDVWGPGTAITDRVVDTHVANLRRKIEPEPSQPRYLSGVRGTGYRFDG
jgi:DNA-binding response OmpR family regulator